MTTPQRMPRVRIRGIYATAMTKLLREAGFMVTQASRVIIERLNIPDINVPADVTIKSTEDDMNRLLVVGYPWAVDRIGEVLRGNLPYSLYLRSRLSLHSVVVVKLTGTRVDDGCEGVVNGVRVVVRGLEECREGELVKGSVARTAVKVGEPVLVDAGSIHVVGDYAMVFLGKGKPRTSFSEHIRDKGRRAELAAIAMPYTEQGYSIHWRSSARYGDTYEIEEELRDLIGKAKLLESIKPTGEGILEEGEALMIVDLSSRDKAVLDELRSSVTPTIPLHHSIKANYAETSLPEIVDYAEKALAHNAPTEPLHHALLEEVAERLSRQRRLEIMHVKLDGSYITIGPGRLQSLEASREGLRVVIERRVRNPGVYDGLDVEKEPGDVIYTYIDTSSWTVRHEYYSCSGELKGVYLNINTPPEPTPRGFRYIDLEADLVNRGDGWRLIDVEKLAEAYREGRVTEKLVEVVAGIAAEKLRQPKRDILAMLTGRSGEE